MRGVCQIRSPSAWLSVSSLLLAALILAACGGGTGDPAPEPRLDPALARSLAERTEAAAARLEAGDACGAEQQVAELRTEVERETEAGRIPAALRAPLRRSLDRIEAGIECVPAPPPPPPKAERKGKKKKDKQGKHGHDDEDDD